MADGAKRLLGREVELDSRQEIQVQRRKPERLLILLVQKVIQPAVQLNAAWKPVRETCIREDVALVREESAEGAQVRLDIQHRTAQVGIEIEHQPAVLPCGIHASGIPRPAYERLAHMKRRLREGRAVKRQDGGIKASVFRRDEERTGGLEAQRKFRSFSPRVCQIIRHETAEAGQRASQGHNLVFKT